MTKKLKKYVLMYIPTGDIIAYKKLYPDANKRLLISTQHDIYLSKEIIINNQKKYNNDKSTIVYNIVILKRYIKPSTEEYFNYLNFLIGRHKGCKLGIPIVDAKEMIRMDFDTRSDLLDVEFEVIEINDKNSIYSYW